MIRWTTTRQGIIVGLLAGALQFLILALPFGSSLEYNYSDFLFRLRGIESAPKDVVVIALDEDSYRALDVPLNAPWPRHLYAKLLKRLADVGVKRVVFDVLFFGDHPDPSVDQLLAESFSETASVLGAEASRQLVSGHVQETLLLPKLSFRKAALSLGLVGFAIDHGTVRRFSHQQSALDSNILPLSLSAVEGLQSMSDMPTKHDLINYYGGPRTVTTVPFYQVIDPDVPLPRNFLENKLIFIGLSLRTGTGADQKDAYLTPFGAAGFTYGVEIHATAAANVLTNNWIRRSSEKVEKIFLLVCAVLVAGIIATLRPITGIASLLFIAIAWSSASYFAFINHHFLPGLTVFGITLPIAILCSTLWWYLHTLREQRRLRDAFSLYLSPDMARAVAANVASLELGGKQVVATALFTDIAGFTNISESLSPRETAQMLNAYFTEVMDAIFEKRGTLIKFIGDAVFALWGAPIEEKKHAQYAYEAARSIVVEVERFNQESDFPRLETRIGLNTGPMLVGNLGAKKRFDFTAIGDSVNLAARVEGLNKYLGSTLLMTGDTYAELSDSSELIFLGDFAVSGKEKATKLYGLFSNRVDVSALSDWKEALQALADKDVMFARNIFEKLASSHTQFSKASSLYLEAISNAIDSPTQPWNGVIRFDQK